MKKIKILSVVTIIALGIWFGLTYIFSNNQAKQCQNSKNTGWAPIGPKPPIGCDGAYLDENSPLIQDGYTCYCHNIYTCWDGQKCVEIK